jgi:proteic killer suppression protein
MLTSDNCHNTLRFHQKVITSFQHKGLKRLYEKDDGKLITQDLLAKLKRILTILDTATNEQALNLPGYNLHALKGELKGYWSVMVSGNWRVIFRFEDGNASKVDLIDYH